MEHLEKTKNSLKIFSKRALFAGGISLLFFNKEVKAESVDLKVPDHANKIRVRSWDKNNNLIMDTSFNVQPGQKFKIDTIR